jgi:hypothetical protein
VLLDRVIQCDGFAAEVFRHFRCLKDRHLSSVPELNFCSHYRLTVDSWQVLLATLPTFSSCCVISFLEHCPKEATCICFKIYKNAIINCVMLMNRYIMKLSWCIYTCYSPISSFTCISKNSPFTDSNKDAIVRSSALRLTYEVRKRFPCYQNNPNPSIGLRCSVLLY